MTKLKIKVTKETLKKSAFCLGAATENCAIAVEVRQVFPNAIVTHVNIIYDMYKPGIHLPKTAMDFILEFDRSTPLERTKISEFEFEVELPDALVDTIDISELTNHPNLQLVCAD